MLHCSPFLSQELIIIEYLGFGFMKAIVGLLETKAVVFSVSTGVGNFTHVLQSFPIFFSLLIRYQYHNHKVQRLK